MFILTNQQDILKFMKRLENDTLFLITLAREPVKHVSYQMKSVQWLQKVGCLKNLAVNLWFLTSWMFFCLRAPLRANRFAIPPEDASLKCMTSAISEEK